MGATKINLEVDEKVLFSFFFFFLQKREGNLGCIRCLVSWWEFLLYVFQHACHFIIARTQKMVDNLLTNVFLIKVCFY